MRKVKITRTIYTAEELRTARPAAFQNALDQHIHIVHQYGDTEASPEAIAYETSPEGFIEYARDNEIEFYESGQIVE